MDKSYITTKRLATATKDFSASALKIVPLLAAIAILVAMIRGYWKALILSDADFIEYAQAHHLLLHPDMTLAEERGVTLLLLTVSAAVIGICAIMIDRWWRAKR